MKKNIITNKITPCCGLPFSTIYWWVSNLTLNSENDRKFILSKISQSGKLSIDGWKTLINSGTLESDSNLTKADFLAWFNCGNQPTCEQLKVIIESYKIGVLLPKELPDNIATIDGVFGGVQKYGNTYDKQQIKDLINESIISDYKNVSPITMETVFDEKSWGFAESGTYPNAGNLEISNDVIGLIFYDGESFSKIEYPIEIPADVLRNNDVDVLGGISSFGNVKDLRERFMKIVTSNDVSFSVLDSLNKMGWLTQDKNGLMPDFVKDYISGLILKDHDEMSKSNSHQYNCVGDSITEGGSPGQSYPIHLQNIFGNSKIVINEGHSGRTSADLAVWTGGLTPILIAGLSLPATTAEVSIHRPIEITIGKFKGFTVSGTLNGVRVILKFADDETTFTVKRETAGTAVNIPSGTPFLADGLKNLDKVLIWWTGQNDLAFGWPYYETAPRDCALATISKMPVEIKRFLVIGVTNGSANAEFMSVTETINNNLRNEFPNNFIDMQKIFIEDGLSMAGITPTTDDLTAISEGRVPPSLLYDDVHPNEDCKRLVIAPTVYKELAKRGWV